MQWSSQCCYNLHIAAIFYTATIVFAQNDIFIAAEFWSTAISKLTLQKHIYYGGFMSCHCKTQQKTRATVAISKKSRNMRHIAAVFAPATIVQISCSDKSLKLYNTIKRRLK